MVPFKEAYQFLRMLGSAGLLVTENLQCALAGVALGTTVIYIDTSGRGDIKNGIPNSLFITVDMYNQSAAEEARKFP